MTAPFSLLLPRISNALATAYKQASDGRPLDFSTSIETEAVSGKTHVADFTVAAAPEQAANFVELALHNAEAGTEKEKLVRMPAAESIQAETWQDSPDPSRTSQKIWEAFNKISDGRNFLTQLDFNYAKFLSRLAKLNPKSLELTKHVSKTAETGDMRKTEQLIKEGADITFDEAGHNPFYYAIKYNKPETLAKLAQTFPHWVNMPCTTQRSINGLSTEPGWHPLRVAIAKEDLESAQVLIAERANPNTRSGLNNDRTPIEQLEFLQANCPNNEVGQKRQEVLSTIVDAIRPNPRK